MNDVESEPAWCRGTPIRRTPLRMTGIQKETPMFPFDVILFDVGGVLLTNGWDHRERAAAVKNFRLDAAALEAAARRFFAAWERGEISGQGLPEYSRFL